MQIVTLAELFQGLKPKLPPLISPVKKASRVETRASHQKGSQGAFAVTSSQCLIPNWEHVNS